MMTKVGFIRQVLKQDINKPSAELVKLTQQAGFNCNLNDIYNIRSLLKKQRKDVRKAAILTINSNKETLGNVVLRVLAKRDMYYPELEDAVLETGYVTHSKKFQDVLKTKLRELRQQKKVFQKENGPFCVVESQAEQIFEKVQAKRQAKIATVVVEEEDKSESNTDIHSVLWRACVTFAKANQIDNPETFPSRLIKNQKSLEVASKTVEESLHAFRKVSSVVQ